MRTTVHADVAQALVSKNKPNFEEAQRRLSVIIEHRTEHGRGEELAEKIIEILERYPTALVEVPPKVAGRKLKRQPMLIKPNKSNKPTSNPKENPKEKRKRGRKRLPQLPSPTLTGINIQADPQKTLLAVSLGGPEGIISPEMQELNPWRDDLIVVPEAPEARHSLHAIRPGKRPEKILKDAGLAKRRAYPRKVTNRMGGKESLMPRYDTETHPLIPRQRFDTFIDALGGSLAVTGYMVRTGRIGPETHTVICERHPDLATVYKAIRMDVEGLIEHLKRLKERQCPSLYNQKVAEYNLSRDLKKEEDPIYVAARYIYLLASCIGSTLRESKIKKRGHINVIPRLEKELARVKMFDPTNLRMMSLVLQNATIIEGGHEEARRFLPQELDNTCYFADPPYYGQETTNEYGVPPFDENCQKSVSETAKMVHNGGGMAIVTNSDTPFIRDLYRRMPTKKEISVNDSLSGVEGQKRQELFLSSYTLRWRGELM